jgi:hypothetical protein
LTKRKLLDDGEWQLWQAKWKVSQKDGKFNANGNSESQGLCHRHIFAANGCILACIQLRYEYAMGVNL